MLPYPDRLTLLQTAVRAEVVEAGKVLFADAEGLAEGVKILAVANFVQQCVAKPTILLALDKDNLVFGQGL